MEELIQLTKKRKIPLTATIEVTYRCNFKCKYCFQNSLRKQILDSELSVSEWKNFLNDLAKRGCIYLIITGGEICAKNGIEEIYKYAYNLGYIIDLHSNLSFLKESPLLDIIKTHKPNSVVVTLYGDNGVYKNFCGINNGWDKIKENILELKKNNIAITARSVFHNDNLHSMNKIKEFVTENNIPINVYTSIMTDSDLVSKCSDLTISEKEIFNVYKKFDKEKKIKEIILSKDIRVDKYCSAGLNSFFINPYGEIFLCPTLLTIAKKFNIKNGFEECWNNLYLERKKYIEKTTPCDKCSNKSFCGICNATYLKEYKSDKNNLLTKCQNSNFIKQRILENERIKED